MRPVVLVTGGAGYVGSHACKALAAAGYLPVTYDNLSTGNEWAVRWGPLENGDIRDRSRLDAVLRTARPLAIMHFAGVAIVGDSSCQPDYYYDVNLAGTINLISACHERGITTLIFSSSCATYGIPVNCPIRETTPQCPINPYGASKQMAERALVDFSAAYGIRHAILRYFNAAGADPEGDIGEYRKTETHLIPLVLDGILGTRPPIQIMGCDYPTPDGTAIRDFVHVADLADANVVTLRRLLDGCPSFALNLGSGSGHSVRQVIATAEEVTGRPVSWTAAVRRGGDPPVLVADTTLARQEFGISFPRSRLPEIVRDAWHWHRGASSARAA